jgi:hypothetical protein
MRHLQAFGCPVFALENDLAAGNSIPHWSPCARLCVNQGPSPLHARNIYLVLNLHTGCVSPQYHCRFENFFETVKHRGPDNSVPMALQQLSGLTIMTKTPSMEHHDKAPSPSQRMQFGITMVVPAKNSDNTIFFDDTADTPNFFDQPMQNFSKGQSVAMANDGGTASHQPSQPSQDSAILPSVSTGARTSLRERVCKMSRAMAKSVSQQEFHGSDKMHYMVSQAICKHDYERLHNNHLVLQEHMHHPIAFLAKMMGDIMYLLHQALHQPDAREFVEAVIKEINGHVDNDHWKLIPCAALPEDTEVVSSVWAMQHK